LVRKIVEGQSEDGKPMISDQTFLAIQVTGDWEVSHPRVCWHSQIQDVLVVAIGKFVLTIDIGKVQQKAPPGGFSAEQPIVCQVESPLEGVHVVGTHEEDVSDLAVPSFGSSCVASASQDGTMRIWGDKTRSLLSDIVPHGGEAVSAVAFLSAPRRPDHHVILTAGPLNRELKLWASTGSPEESPSKPNTGMWNCIQTLEFQSSTAAGKLENAFFNQLVVAPWASLILLANAKKNAIYAVHVEFGVGSVPARMNYLAEFSVKIPILSFTVTEETEGTVQVYCVQTQAIQQYILDVSQCLPPPDEEYNSEPMSMLDKDPVLPQTYDAARNSTGDKGAADFLELGSTAATVIVPAPSVSVPPRSMTASSAFGSPVEVGHREDLHAVTERTRLLDIAGPATVAPVKEILDNFGRSTSEPTPTNQPSRESVSQVATMPVSHPEVAPASSVAKPPQPSKRRSRSKSPTKPDLKYVPVVKASLTQTDEKLEKPLDNQPEPSSLLTPTTEATLERAQSASSSNSSRDDVPSREERDGFSGTSNAMSGAHPLHLITPFELMNLATSSKSFDTHGVQTSGVPQEPIVMDRNPEDAQPCFAVEDLNTTDAPTAMEKEVVESEGLDDRGNDSLLSESHEVFHAGASTEYNEKAQESPGKPSLLDMYSKEESVQVEEGDILEDRERPTHVTVDGAHEQLRDMAFREAGSVPLPSQISAIAKGRKNKNKTYDGGVEPAAVRSSSPQIPDLMTPGAMPEGESSYNVNSAHLDPGLAAQVSTMQDALNQVQRSYFLLFLLELAEIVSFWVDISRQIGQVLVA
jgi:enhancer of mRNA-decapping protein 4